MPSAAMTAQRADWPDAKDVSRQLARQIATLAPELLSNGRRAGNLWRCGSVANERGQSLWLHLSGPRAGHWTDGATGECGDALDLVAATRFAGDRKQAYRWSLDYLGIAPQPCARSSPVAPVQAPPEDGAAAADDAQRRRAAALRLWLSAQPSLTGTPAEAYLRGRGIDLAALGRQPRALRYAPALPHGPSGRSFPALLAAVSGDAGAHTATHRTWIARDADGAWRKAPVTPAKMSLGSVVGGSIRIWRGESGKPLAEAPADDVIVIGEGIETCLSIALAVPECRVLCAVSLANLATVALPPQVRSVILAADNDTGAAAQRGLARAVEAHRAAGRAVRVARAAVGKDFNDTLQAWADG